MYIEKYLLLEIGPCGMEPGKIQNFYCELEGW